MLLRVDPFEGLQYIELPLCDDVREMFTFWRPYAWQTAIGLWGVALLLFGGITTGIVEEKHDFWQVCLAVMIISLMGAVVTSVIFYRDMRSRAAERGVRQRPSSRTHDILVDVEAVRLMASSP